jgi:hypothetical protein
MEQITRLPTKDCGNFMYGKIVSKSFIHKVLSACIDEPREEYELIDLMFIDDEGFFEPRDDAIVSHVINNIDIYVKDGYLELREFQDFIRIKQLGPGGRSIKIPTAKDKYVITFKGRWMLHQLESIDLPNK